MQKKGKKNMKKKAIGLLMAGAMAAALLTGCGEKTDNAAGGVM